MVARPRRRGRMGARFQRSLPMKPHHCLLLMPMLLLVACGKPQPPDTERPPEPQAGAMREAIAQPLEKAQAAKTAVEEATGAEDAALKSAESAAE